MAKMTVFDREIRLRTQADADYISLTDISRYRDEDRSDDLIRNWLRNRNTLEFLGIWEQLYNPDFNSVEFDGFKSDAGLNSFTLTPKQWIEKTGAIGIVSKAGRYGGTYAHSDIAFEFASWISVEFKLYLIKEFQRLKEEERGWPGRHTAGSRSDKKPRHAFSIARTVSIHAKRSSIGNPPEAFNSDGAGLLCLRHPAEVSAGPPAIVGREDARCTRMRRYVMRRSCERPAY